MEQGFSLVMISGAYGYTLTLAGWAKRVRGDEWILLAGNRSVFRTGPVDLNGFDKLAHDGPEPGYRLSEPAKIKETLHRILIRRFKPGNVVAWEKFIPRPKDWVEE